MLEITLKNGNTITYKPESFTDYSYHGSVFVVMKESQWIGIYNMKLVAFIEFKEALA